MDNTSSSPLTAWIVGAASQSGTELSTEDILAIDKQVYDPETDDGLETHLGAIFNIVGTAFLAQQCGKRKPPRR